MFTTCGDGAVVRCVCVLGFLAMGANAHAQAPSPQNALVDLSIEELMRIPITSVSKRVQDLKDAPAAIFVLTSDDIRRSGMTSIPELLRMVPGLDVAQINGNSWAISSRGFNYQYANKLLVLIDGRSVYTPAFAGVYWNLQDLVLEDLERIEVIRGPGATLWGANAVNGIINIMTKNAAQTQGALVSVTVGTEERPSASVRYGGNGGDHLHYRVYGKFFDRTGLVDGEGQEAPDKWRMTRAGFRLDWEKGNRDQITFQGDAYGGTTGQTATVPELTPPFSRNTILSHENFGGNVIGRWTRRFSARSDLALQVYFDKYREGELDSDQDRTTYDLDFHHRFPLGSRHDVVWGLGYRRSADRFSSNSATSSITWNPPARADDSYNAFVQDEITLVPRRLSLTVGSKFEHRDLTDFQFQPSARLLWSPVERQTVWGAVSRALRTPSRFEQTARLDVAAFQPPSSPPVLVSLFPNSDSRAERATSYELGYRVEPATRVSFDVTGFYTSYDRLNGFAAGAAEFELSPAPPHVLVPNVNQDYGTGETHGVEFAARWNPVDRWRLAVGYAWLHIRMDGFESPNPQADDNPKHQLQVRSYVDLSRQLEVNAATYYVDRISSPAADGRVEIPAYVRLDVGVTYRHGTSLEMSVGGQNLLDDRHPEFASQNTVLVTYVPRRILMKIVLHF